MFIEYTEMELKALAQMILSQIPATKYPHLHELTAKHVLSDEYAYSDEFIYGLELILDQLSVRKGLQ